MLPCYSTVRLRAVIKGMHHLRGDRPPEREVPIRTQHLAMGLKTSLGKNADGLCARAALSVAFCGLLRISEYAMCDGGLFDEAKLPTVGDVGFGSDEHGEYAAVDIRAAKKGAKSRGKSSRVLLRDGELLQPVTALREMLTRRRGPGKREPLFMWKGNPLSKAVVTSLVKLVMGAAGQDPRLYNSHGLRIGGATAALAAGVSPEAIRVMGRWDSDVYRIYCRRSRQVALQLGTVIASTGFESLDDAFTTEELL